MKDCIFCKIVKGEIPCHKVYEDKEFFAFLDLNPVNEGHTLVIPKEHCETILDASDSVLSKILFIVKKLDNTLLRVMNTDACNIDINQGKAAGQTMMHLHFHIIPRFTTDKLIEWPTNKFSEAELKKTADKIRNG